MAQEGNLAEEVEAGSWGLASAWAVQEALLVAWDFGHAPSRACDCVPGLQVCAPAASQLRVLVRGPVAAAVVF